MRASPGFWNRIARRYARSPIADEASYERKLAMTREFLGPDVEAFEFGCGTGSTAIAHAPHVRHLRAVDFSEKMIEIARGRAAEAGADNVTFEVGDIEALDVAEAHYDVVLALSVLHLLEDRDAALTRAATWLKPGGVLVTSTACLGDFMPVFRYLAPMGRRVGLLPLVRVFTADELVASMTRAGLDIVVRWQPAPNKALFIIARKPR